MSAELASWSLNYRTRDQDLFGTPRYGPLRDRANYLDDIVTRLDQAADLLVDLPRLS